MNKVTYKFYEILIDATIVLIINTDRANSYHNTDTNVLSKCYLYPDLAIINDPNRITKEHVKIIRKNFIYVGYA